MAAGITPVVSNTGFAAQIIEQGVTGHIVEHDTSVKEISSLLREPSLNSNKIKAATKSWGWNEMGKLIADKMLESIFPRRVAHDDLQFKKFLQFFSEDWQFDHQQNTLTCLNSGSIYWFGKVGEDVTIHVYCEGLADSSNLTLSQSANISVTSLGHLKINTEHNVHLR